MDDVHYEADALNALNGGGIYDGPGDGRNWNDDECWMQQLSMNHYDDRGNEDDDDHDD